MPLFLVLLHHLIPHLPPCNHHPYIFHTPFVSEVCRSIPPLPPLATNEPTYPCLTTYPISFKVNLPDISKIPILSSGTDWPLWFHGISDMIDNLCLYHYISPDLTPGVVLNYFSSPFFLPILHGDSSPDEIALCGTW